MNTNTSVPGGIAIAVIALLVVSTVTTLTSAYAMPTSTTGSLVGPRGPGDNVGYGGSVVSGNFPASLSAGVHDNAAITSPTHVPIQAIIVNLKATVADVKQIIAAAAANLGPVIVGKIR